LAVVAQCVDALANPAWRFADVNPLFWVFGGVSIAIASKHSYINEENTKSAAHSFRVCHVAGSQRMLRPIVPGAMLACSFLSISGGGVTAAVYNAYVFVGDVTTFLAGGRESADYAAAEAINDFQQAGYNPIFYRKAENEDFLTALRDPNARAIWFMGHGTYDEETGIPEAEILFTGGKSLYPAQVPRSPQISSFTLHACGQGLHDVEWKEPFPSLRHFHAWAEKTRHTAMRSWQRKHEYPVIGLTGHPLAAVGAQAPAASVMFLAAPNSPVQPQLHPRLQPTTDQFIFLPEAQRLVVDMGAVTNVIDSFVLDWRLRRYIDGRAFNLYTMGSLGDSLLFSAAIKNGIVDLSSASTNPAYNAVFDVRIREDVYHMLLENPDRWTAFSADISAVHVANRTAGVILDRVALEAIGKVIWGSPVPIRITAGTAHRNPATGVTNQLIVLQNVGDSALSGPLALVLANLSSDSILLNMSGSTTRISPRGSPYIDIEVGADNLFRANEVARVTLQFNNPPNNPITYNALVETGAIGAR
ncbi:MAG: hypothetical protein M3463_05585, partial [Verrucomicrobiota bacterium]|nr:hypothetical protein [Verrucomicrobiota bacterium]